MKKGRKIALIIIAAVVIILAALIIWQWGNIRALTMALRYSGDELSGLMEENEASMESAVGKLPDIVFNPLTEEERKQLRDGELSEEAAVAIVTGKTAEESAAPSAPDPADAELEAKKERAATLVATIYVMRDTFTSRLEGIKNAAAAEYRALPEEERTDSAKAELMMRCIDQAGALELECDAVVDSILAELRQLLPEIGGELSLVNEVKAIYADEKAIKKAYYLNLYS